MQEGPKLTPEQQRRLNNLVHPSEQTDDLFDNLVRGGHATVHVRDENSLNGGAVYTALNEQYGIPWREIEELFDIPYGTAHRWGKRFRELAAGEEGADAPGPPG
jgi:hypothetical protein